MRKQGDLILVHLVDKLPVGSIFEATRSGWPLHITLLPWFFGDKTTEFNEQVAIIAQQTEAFTVKVGGIEQFGPNQDIPVNVIENQTPLEKLHQSLKSAASLTGMIVRAKDQWAFRAHVTHHVGASKQPKTGDILEVGDIHLIQLIDNNKAQVITKFPFARAGYNEA